MFVHSLVIIRPNGRLSKVPTWYSYTALLYCSLLIILLELCSISLICGILSSTFKAQCCILISFGNFTMGYLSISWSENSKVRTQGHISYSLLNKMQRQVLYPLSVHTGRPFLHPPPHPQPHVIKLHALNNERDNSTTNSTN